MGKTVKKIKSPSELRKLRREILKKRDPKKPVITVCVSTGCSALGAGKVVEALKKEIKKRKLERKVEVKETGCLGFCELGPRLIVYPKEIPYFKVKPEDVPEIISKTVIGKKVVERLLYVDPVTGKKARKLEEIPFYKHQLRLLLGNNARIDPKKIEDYIALGGYRALAKALFRMTPEQVIEEIKKSNLRGRGGGGFPTGRKWETTRNAPGEPKYVLVNCDEGDPGAFMDRSLMEGNPHSVLEGLIIGAYAIGAHEGFIYVREEYPMAVENITTAIKQAEEYGLLGENIMGSGFSFKVKVHRGAGAFVSGESSALMTAIEGKVGEPRPKYIHTAVKGLWEKPSCLNNVETWANVPLIILKGADWFRSIGTKNSPGTKIFSLVGKVNNTGLVEVPMGITLRDLIYKIGGGIRSGKKFKAVQTGGPSGGFIPEKYLDLPIDFDELTKVGSMMGSGGVIVMDEDTCIVDVTRYYIDFLSEESCGKCVPCREGLKQTLNILNRICAGLGKEEDLKTLEDLSELLREASLCALGTTAANPIMTSLNYFREEYEAHIREKRCPAKVCSALIAYYIQPEKCQACMICSRNCPVNAISGERDIVHVINQEKCIKCGICYEVCPFGAVEKISPPTPPPPQYGVKVIRKKK
ncbi:NADH-quinone oxidoreductase subunit F [Candidatus Bathyarchaeota archaeon]|nr:MAG: NADH-quinone oxidoreductase subunit F [Candidatus Bathyarchaeota archaeon]